MINLYFLSFQQKGKPEEFSIGLTISLGLCPAQNKMFHFMPGLIETCLKCGYIFKLFISKSLFSAHIRRGQCSVNDKSKQVANKKSSLFVLPLLAIEVSALCFLFQFHWLSVPLNSQLIIIPWKLILKYKLDKIPNPSQNFNPSWPFLGKLPTKHNLVPFWQTVIYVFFMLCCGFTKRSAACNKALRN